jgi:hypothetical protein
MGQAVVRRGVAFWALDPGVLGARLDQIDEHGAVTDMHLVPYNSYGTPYPYPDNRLLGISPDNRLFFMDFGIIAEGESYQNSRKSLIANLEYFEFEEEDNIHTIRKAKRGENDYVLMRQMRMSHADNVVKLRWFGEKSGLVLFTLGRPSGNKGTFLLNLHEKVVNQVVSYHGDSWKNLLGYEMDMAAYLACSLDPRS